MKTMTKTLLLLTSFFGFISNGFAAPYVLGQLGIFGTEFSFDDGMNSQTTNDVRATGRIAGGYMWSEGERLQPGIELGVQFFQTMKSSFDSYYIGHMDSSIKRTTFDILGVADYYVTPCFDLFAKAGAALVTQKEKANFTYLSFEDSQSETYVSPKLMLGMGYQINKNTNLNIAYSHEFDSNHSNIVDKGASTLLAGVKYSFL